MADRQDTGILYKKEIKLPAAIGDWTAYKPPKQAWKRAKPSVYSSQRSPREFLEDNLKTHNLFSFEFAKYLKDALKASSDIFAVSIEQLTYLDFLKRVTGGIIYSKLMLKTAGEAMLLIDYQLANIIINFSLGFQTIDTKPKEFTDLEESIIQSVFDNVLDKYTKCWKNIFEKPALDIISYPTLQRETHINLNEIITVVTIEISIANSVPSLLTFVYQNGTLKNLNALQAKKEDKLPLNFSILPAELLNSIKIPVIAELGTTNVFSRELASIEEDDVVVLDQKVNEPVEILLGYTTQMKAQPGLKNDHICLKILGSSTKKVKNTLITKPEPSVIKKEISEKLEVRSTQEPEEQIQPQPGIESIAEPEETVSQQQHQEEDFELPLEEEEKEEYNAEELFDEDNKTQP